MMDEIARLRAQVSALQAQQERALELATCRNGGHHYCPNCGNSLFDLKAALAPLTDAEKERP
jgi:membrane protease subunit (stomatin/prohibitin family)